MAPRGTPAGSLACTFDGAIRRIDLPARERVLSKVNEILASATMPPLEDLTDLNQKILVNQLLSQPHVLDMIRTHLGLSLPTLDPLVAICRESSEFSDEEGRLERVRFFLSSIMRKFGPQRLRTDLAPYASFPDEPRTYKRHWLFYEKDLFEMLLLCWKPGARAGAHDHAESGGIDCVLDGTMVETTYELVPTGEEGAKRPKFRTRRDHSAGNVLMFSAALVHDVTNPEDEGANLMTLHVYIPPLNLNNINGYGDWI